jgi:hypothetical protein
LNSISAQAFQEIGCCGKKLRSFYYDFYHGFGLKKTVGKKAETGQTDPKAFTKVEVETSNKLRQLWPV